MCAKDVAALFGGVVTPNVSRVMCRLGRHPRVQCSVVVGFAGPGAECGDGRTHGGGCERLPGSRPGEDWGYPPLAAGVQDRYEPPWLPPLGHNGMVNATGS